MKKEEIITIIIMSIIIIADLITQKYLDNTVSLVSGKLYDLKEIASDNEEMQENELENRINDIYKEWKDKCKELSYFIDHEGMEEIDLNLEKAKENFKLNQKDDAITEINEGIYKLNFLRDKQKLTLSNVF